MSMDNPRERARRVLLFVVAAIEREGRILDRISADLGHLPLSAVTRDAVVAWRSSRAVAPRTANAETGLFGTVLRAAVAHGHLDADPLDGLRPLHAPSPRRRLLAPDDERRILAAMRQPDDRALLIMALDTLMRLGECLAVRWRDVAEDAVWCASPKAGAGHWRPTTARLRAALAALGRGDPDSPVFARHAASESPRDCARRARWALQQACARCDPPIPYGRPDGVSWHWATRRTMATRMIRAGVDLATVQRAGHWADASIVIGIYAESEQAAVRGAIEAASGTAGAHEAHPAAKTGQQSPE